MNINRGDTSGLPFVINDTGGSLLGKRVTFSIGTRVTTDSLVLKVGGLPGSTSDISVAVQNANQIAGTIWLSQADYAKLPEGSYRYTLWVDDGTVQRAVTVGGSDTLVINPAIART